MRYNTDNDNKPTPLPYCCTAITSPCFFLSSGSGGGEKQSYETEIVCGIPIAYDFGIFYSASSGFLAFASISFTRFS